MRSYSRRTRILLPLLWVCACTGERRGIEPDPPVATSEAEPRLSAVRQLTGGGENAEAYWSPDGKALVFQSTRDGAQCDRIYRMALPGGEVSPVSNGQGVTTCAYFLPRQAGAPEEVVYASTQLASPDCPPPPDRSQGYVWAVRPDYDIFRARADGSEARALTQTPGYDAEATVCSKDGSIVFTSARDGDLELYRMDADGQNVRRLTFAPGYDGGAFFSPDCSRLVWRASRPKEGPELDDYRALLAKGLVKPTKLELYVGGADGSNPTQVTYLDAASFAPFFFPDGRRIIFSSNAGDPKGREFELWAIDSNGTGLERITHTPGFDGFPMFSPDGKQLVFASNRATPKGAHDTNLFLADWVGRPLSTGGQTNGPADRVQDDVTWLAAPEREGRGLGTPGLEAAGGFVESRLKALGLMPGLPGGEFRQHFSVSTALSVGSGTGLSLGKKVVDPGHFRPLSFSGNGAVTARVVPAGYGIVAPELKYDDYARAGQPDVRGAIALVRRFTPEEGPFADTANRRRFGDLRQKAFEAKARGAVGLLVVDAPVRPARVGGHWKPPSEAPFPELSPQGPGDVGIPVAIVSRAEGSALFAPPHRSRFPVEATLQVKLETRSAETFNVVGRVRAGAQQRLPGIVVVGAHYDHLGMGGRDSLAPGGKAPHLGADDNASGVAGLMEIARYLSEHTQELSRDVLLIAFSGEERGVLGSSHFIRELEKSGQKNEVIAMLNLDMVGRMRANKLNVLGTESAAEWPSLVQPSCDAARVDCSLGGDGYGPSDHMPFYAAGIPVLHFFTGAHADYHKPSDSADRINAAGLAKASEIAAHLAIQLSQRNGPLSLRRVAAPAPNGDLRSFNASLGTIPDYAGPPPGQAGVLIAGTRPGGPAERAGIVRGDLLIRLGSFELRSVEDFAYALSALKPGQRVPVTLTRGGKQVVLDATLGEGHR